MSVPLVQADGVAAVIAKPNINTDVIAPPARAGKADAFGPQDDGAARLFGPWRYNGDGSEREDFILNRPPFRQARFLIAGPNFACGSSRETAPAWLHAFGIRVILAPSFGGIFYDNCFRNGLLPLIVEPASLAGMEPAAERGEIFRLDLPARVLRLPDGAALPIDIPGFRLHQLISGEDELAITMREVGRIDSYQQRSRAITPWIWPETRP
jgi:3-isopropylmalate/(R)-2-methylmalate dehydratase small subunit